MDVFFFGAVFSQGIEASVIQGVSNFFVPLADHDTEVHFRCGGDIFFVVFGQVFMLGCHGGGFLIFGKLNQKKNRNRKNKIDNFLSLSLEQSDVILRVNDELKF